MNNQSGSQTESSNWLIDELANYLAEKVGDIDKLNFNEHEVLINFQQYVEKINNGSFSLDDYTNIFNKDKANDTEYLCHFLETTSIFFGSSRPGNANQFGIKKNAKDEGYYISSKLKNTQEIKNTNDDKVVSEAFEYIKRSLKSIAENDLNCSNFDTLANNFNDSPIEAKQCLLKFIYLKNMDKLIPIYKKEVLQSICQGLGILTPELKAASILKLNYRIAKQIIEELQLNQQAKEQLFIISQRLWELFGATFTMEALNTILHGAPGTGKTFSTLKSIENEIKSTGGNIHEQLCVVQFHPSYGYEDFIDGIKPKGITTTGQIQLELVNGQFKELCIKAFNNLLCNKKDSSKAKKYYFVADEINRAELSRVFGEVLLCLEEDKRLHFNKEGKLEGSMLKTMNSSLWTAQHVVVIWDKNKKEPVLYQEQTELYKSRLDLTNTIYLTASVR